MHLWLILGRVTRDHHFALLQLILRQDIASKYKGELEVDNARFRPFYHGQGITMNLRWYPAWDNFPNHTRDVPVYLGLLQHNWKSINFKVKKKGDFISMIARLASSVKMGRWDPHSRWLRPCPPHANSRWPLIGVLPRRASYRRSKCGWKWPWTPPGGHRPLTCTRWSTSAFSHSQCHESKWCWHHPSQANSGSSAATRISPHPCRIP